MPDTSYESHSQPRVTPAVQWLIAANVGVYFLQLTLFGAGSVFNALGLDPGGAQETKTRVALEHLAKTLAVPADGSAARR